MTQVKRGEKDHCPACDAEDIDESIEVFEAVCEECGFVIREDTNSVSLEWEIIEGEFQHGSQDWSDEYRVRNATEKQLAQAFKVLEDFANQLTLSNKVHEGTVDLYCDAFRAGLTDGRNTTCVVAACLCLSSRREQIPIPVSRLVDFEGVDKRKFGHCRLALSETLDVRLRTPKPREFVAFLDSEFSFTSDEAEAAEKMVTAVNGVQKLVGKDPAGIAAGAVYIVQREYTQRELSEAVGLSTETVRQRIKDLRLEVNDV